MQPKQLDTSQENNRKIMSLAELLKMTDVLYECLGHRKIPPANWFYFEIKSFLR
jgi:ABC-type cobalamin transport system permease subunit